MLALSVSISTISWPFSTSSPSETIHFRIVPSSIESDRRGIVTSVAMSVGLLEVSEGCDRRLHDVLLVRERCLLERLRVGHQDVGAGHAGHRCVEVVERLLLDQRGQVRANAAVRPALL